MKKIVLLLIFISSISIQAQGNIDDGRYSIIELIANPEKYNGKRVSICGFFSYTGGDLGAIYISKDDKTYRIAKNAFIIYFSNDNLGNLDLKSLNNHFIVINGYFNPKIKGFSNYFSGSLNSVTYIEEILSEEVYLARESKSLDKDR